MQAMYLGDNDDRYPPAWTSLVKNEFPYSGYPRFCRWHDPRFLPDGPLWTYLKNIKAHLCPTFKVIAKYEGQNHPDHDKSIPIVPQYSYSMNAYLGSKTNDPSGYGAANSRGLDGIYKFSEITRSKDKVFFFAEENMWLRLPKCIRVLNDNALCGDGRDWFGTFHSTSMGKLNSGTINAVFVDAHVEEVRSALKEDQNDTSEMEFGEFEKFSWPHREPYK
jgi:hypothetical protein